MKTSTSCCRVVAAGLLVCACFTHSVCIAETLDYIGRLGFTDPDHTRSDGYRTSSLFGISDVGYTVGTSKRFASTSHADQSAWMGSPYGGTMSIGFYDAAHTDVGGRHYSRIVKITGSGRVIGLSGRYDGMPAQTGRTAWIASWGGGTRQIGLYDLEPVALPSNSGVRNDVLDVNEAGQSIGVAQFADGQHAWIADLYGNTRTIGLHDAAYTSPGRNPFNTPVVLNPSGTVVGHSLWDGGQAAWLQSKRPEIPARLIGLYDADHTKSNGSVSNTVMVLNDHGYSAGFAEREEISEGTAYTYYDAWISPPAGGTVLFDEGAIPTHITNSNLVGGSSLYPFGSSDSWIYDIDTGTLRSLFPQSDSADSGIFGLTEEGVATGGISFMRGYGCWLAPQGQDAVMIGFYDLEHSAPAPGATASSIVAMAPNGLTIGSSLQMQVEGATAWIANPVTAATYRIGLYDAVHQGVMENGYTSHRSVPTHVTSSRFSAGYSVRLHGDETTEGQTAWVYNSSQARYATFDFSVRASDGYSFSRVNQLLENGVAVGTYTKFADDGADLGDRAFVWITGMGAFDIGENLDVDPETVDWDYLADAVLASESGYISGHGVPFESVSQGVFLVRLQ